MTRQHQAGRSATPLRPDAPVALRDGQDRPTRRSAKRRAASTGTTRRRVTLSRIGLVACVSSSLVVAGEMPAMASIMPAAPSQPEALAAPALALTSGNAYAAPATATVSFATGSVQARPAAGAAGLKALSTDLGALRGAVVAGATAEHASVVAAQRAVALRAAAKRAAAGRAAAARATSVRAAALQAATRQAQVAARQRQSTAHAVATRRAARFTVRAAPTVRAASSARASRSSTRAATGGVLSIAARYKGIMYRYGGSSPSTGFDCSGFTSYVFRQVGVSLPRTANAQMNATHRVSRSAARPGDLVFFTSGGGAYHVGIYAGGNMMWDSPHTGAAVSLRSIWSSAVVFGRP